MNKKIKKMILKWMGVKENDSLIKNIPIDTTFEAHCLWISLLNKCYVPKNCLFPVWGLKGYRVCKDWRDQPYLFFEWLKKNNWNTEMKIDIKKGMKIFSDYSCFLTTYRRYVTRGKYSKVFFYEYKGQEKSLRSWGKQYGIKFSTLKSRVKYFDGDMSKALEYCLYYRHQSSTTRNDVSNEEIKKLYDQGMTVSQIEKKLGFFSVYPRLKKIGVELRYPERSTDRTQYAKHCS